MMVKKFIYVTLQKEFIHSYPEAPKEVEYLRFPHRHIAHIKVEIEVFNNDREIEFILFKHWLDKKISAKLSCYDDSSCSCETIATDILKIVQNEYGTQRDIRIIVSEDGENGAELYFQKGEIING